MRTIEFRFRVRTDFSDKQIHEIVIAPEDSEIRTEIEGLFDYVRIVDVGGLYTESGYDGTFEYVPKSCIAREVSE